MDADSDGIACESLPCPCSKSGGEGRGTPKPTLQPPQGGLKCGVERWSVKTLSDSAATTLTSTGTYASTGSYSWDIVVADSAAAAAIDNAINFTATSN